MVAYWQRPIETASVLSHEGWLHTGDVGEMLPDGFFRLLDRRKDMILVSGFKVYPNEVETVIATHPGVREVAVIGVPDEHSGEAVLAIVVRGSPTLSEGDIREHCRSQLIDYKRPNHIQFIAELPKTGVGKVARRELRARFRSAADVPNDGPRRIRFTDPQPKTSA
jgi:long-chain acyl-CoA synthetase